MREDQQGQWINRTEHVNLNELFDRMTRDELEAYAKDAKLPDWFTQAVGVTQARSQREKNAMNNARKEQSLPVAEVKPGDFPLGSVELRASARMIAEKIANRHKLVRRIVFVPTGLMKRSANRLQCCFRRVEGADEITEFWHWED